MCVSKPNFVAEIEVEVVYNDQIANDPAWW